MATTAKMARASTRNAGKRAGKEDHTPIAAAAQPAAESEGGASVATKKPSVKGSAAPKSTRRAATTSRKAAPAAAKRTRKSETGTKAAKAGTSKGSGAAKAATSKDPGGGKARATKAAKKKPAPRKAPRKADKSTPAASAATPPSPPELPEGYTPNGDEEYMGPLQTEYFRRKLTDWRQALLDESEQTLESMRDQQREVSDEAERASRETEMSFELRTRDRYRKLIRKINEALNRIEDGSYGFCEETGDPIGLGRLEARPIATLSVEAQERREMLERQYRP